MKVKKLSLLIIDEDQDMRQLLAALVSDRYRSVTAAAPNEVGSLIAFESFDVMIVPRIGINFSAKAAGDSRVAEGVTSVAAIKSGVTGNTYEFRSLNQDASSWVINPFERVYCFRWRSKTRSYLSGISKELRKMTPSFERRSSSTQMRDQQNRWRL